MTFLRDLLDVFKGWGTCEWSLFATCLIELAVILFYNKGTMKCKERIEQYEDELKTATATCEHFQKLFEERSEAE